MPLTVDLKGGYSDDPAQVADLAARLAGLGVAGVNLEDGRAGAQLRPAAQHAAMIEAVVAAAPAGLFVNARTDTYWLQIGDDGWPAGRDRAATGRLPRGRRLRRVHPRAVRPGSARTGGGLGGAAAERAVAARGRPGRARPGRVARVSTGSALYRHALGGALAAATAARDAGAPATVAVNYADLQNRLLEQTPRTRQ